MPKLYHVYAHDLFELSIAAELLYVAETPEEAEAYAKEEWKELLDEYQLVVGAYEVKSVNGYTIQLAKEE